jgi:hypothetical protein
MSKAQIPSLINGSAGKPKMIQVKQKCPCRGCGKEMIKGEFCFSIPNPRASFSNARRFCESCFRDVLAKTKADVAELEAAV